MKNFKIFYIFTTMIRVILFKIEFLKKKQIILIMNTHKIKYMFTYNKKNGSTRIIKTDRTIEKSTSSHILIWDCENDGWRSLIKNRIQEAKQYKPIFTYKKKDGKIRDIKTDGNITDLNNNIRVWDIQNNGWRTLIKESIQETLEFQTISVYN